MSTGQAESRALYIRVAARDRGQQSEETNVRGGARVHRKNVLIITTNSNTNVGLLEKDETSIASLSCTVTVAAESAGAAATTTSSDDRAFSVPERGESSRQLRRLQDVVRRENASRQWLL